MIAASIAVMAWAAERGTGWGVLALGIILVGSIVWETVSAVRQRESATGRSAALRSWLQEQSRGLLILGCLASVLAILIVLSLVFD